MELIASMVYCTTTVVGRHHQWWVDLVVDHDLSTMMRMENDWATTADDADDDDRRMMVETVVDRMVHSRRVVDTVPSSCCHPKMVFVDGTLMVQQRFHRPMVDTLRLECILVGCNDF